MPIINPPNISYDPDESESAIRPEPISMKEKQRSGVSTEEEKKKAVIEEVKAFNAECLALKNWEKDISSIYADIFERHGALVGELNAQQWPHYPKNTVSQMKLPSFRTSLQNINARTAPEAVRETVTALESAMYLKFARQIEAAQLALGDVGAITYSATTNLVFGAYGETESSIRELMSNDIDKTLSSVKKSRAEVAKAIADGFNQAVIALRNLVDAFHNIGTEAAEECDTVKLRGGHEDGQADQRAHLLDLQRDLYVAEDLSELLGEAYFEKGKKLGAAMTYVASLGEGDWATQAYEFLNIVSRKNLSTFFPEVIAESAVV